MLLLPRCRNYPALPYLIVKKGANEISAECLGKIEENSVVKFLLKQLHLNFFSLVQKISLPVVV